MTSSPTQLRVPKTAEVLAGRLRAQIVRGELKEGESLPNEPELMERFGVSRHILREAYRILESERLITVRRGARGGALVLAPDPQVAARHVGVILQARGTTLNDLERARIAIEPLAVRWLTESPDAAAKLAILRTYNEQAAAFAEDPAAFSYRSFAFHRKVVELAGNTTLSVIMDMLAELIQLHIAVRQSAPEYDLEDRIKANNLSVRANARMLRLVEAGDADGAEKYWREHVTAVVSHLTNPPGPLTVVDLLT
jgi:GntR family transcriptional repressor for pyruvate dehydrogenase complex